MPLSKSALYYRTHPEAAKKHRAYNIKRNKSKKQTAYRVELNKERRARGIYGKGGPDMSHTESGKLVEEDPSKNRGRNGTKGESTKRKDFVKGKKCGESFIPRTHKCNLTAGSVVRTTQKTAILGAGAALGVIAAIQTRSLWTPALGRLYEEARKAGKPWSTYAAKQKADLRDPQVRALAKARAQSNKRACVRSRGDNRSDAWTPCNFTIGEPSAYGRVIKHPNQPIVFKVPKEVHYVPVSDGVKMTGSKKLRKKVADMFEKEASNLQYANRIGVDSPKLEGFNPNKSVIAMEFLDGYYTYRTLQGTNKNLDSLVNFQLFGNLKRMQMQGLTHRDLHRGNILVNPRTRRIAIIDFGHASKLKDVGLEEFYTEARTDVGWVSAQTLNLPTKSYLAVEKSFQKYLPIEGKLFNKTEPTPTVEDINQRFEAFYAEVASILLSSTPYPPRA